MHCQSCSLFRCQFNISPWTKQLPFWQTTISNAFSQIKTRTTRTPAFWGYPQPPHDYPYHWVILDPKSKEDKVKVTNLKNSPKFQIFFNFEISIKRYTPSEVAWWDVQIWNGSDEYCWRYRADTILSTDGKADTILSTDGEMERRTDEQTDKVKQVYPPFNFVKARGIMIELWF